MVSSYLSVNKPVERLAGEETAEAESFMPLNHTRRTIFCEVFNKPQCRSPRQRRGLANLLHCHNGVDVAAVVVVRYADRGERGVEQHLTSSIGGITRRGRGAVLRGTDEDEESANEGCDRPRSCDQIDQTLQTQIAVAKLGTELGDVDGFVHRGRGENAALEIGNKQFLRLIYALGKAIALFLTRRWGGLWSKEGQID